MQQKENEGLELNEVSGKRCTQQLYLRDNKEKSDYLTNIPGGLIHECL